MTYTILFHAGRLGNSLTNCRYFRGTERRFAGITCGHDDLRKVRRKISNNELQNALKLFNQICEYQLPGYINESVSFSRRYNEVSKLYNLGMIKLDDRLLMENQLTNSFLTTIIQIGDEYSCY